MPATATLGIERGGRQGREAPGIPGCHPRSRPRVPRLLPPPLAAASARETGRSGADKRQGGREDAPRPPPPPLRQFGSPRPRAHPRPPATPPTPAGRAASQTPHPTRYPRTPPPSGPGSFWKWVILVPSPSPRSPSLRAAGYSPAGLARAPARLGQRGTAPRSAAQGGSQFPARGKERPEEGRQGGRGGEGKRR